MIIQCWQCNQPTLPPNMATTRGLKPAAAVAASTTVVSFTTCVLCTRRNE